MIGGDRDMTDSPLSWAQHLPADEIRSMLLELSRAAEQAFGGNAGEVLAETDTVLATWRTTAQVHADPQLYAALTTPIEPGDLVDAPRPQGAPRRGDQVEQWLKAQRDEYERQSSEQWRALNEVLDTYRRHADTRTPLDLEATK